MPEAKNAHVWERDDLDWYVEPSRATGQLLSVERFIGPVWDPCCGQGNIIKACREAGYEAWGSDVLRRTDEQWFCGERDFLTIDRPGREAENIIFNPPYFKAKGAERFIRHALAIATGKVAAFVDIRFLAGSGRANGLYAEYPPHRVWTVTPRVSCPPGQYLLDGGKAGNGSSDYCWLVWDLTAPYAGTLTSWLTADHIPRGDGRE